LDIKRKTGSEGTKLVNNENKISPNVSIIIPVKNGARTIQELLESLMQMDYDEEKLEVIVVDGSSTDNTQEIVSKFPVRLLDEERPGLNAARNTGIKHSKGEIIAFTDCDCVAPKNWIKRIIENFRDSQVGCVGGNILGYYPSFLSQYCDESAIPVMRIFRNRKVLDMVKPPTQYPAGCNMATKRDVIKKVGTFNENIKYGFDEDEFVERICKKKYKMVLDPRVFVRHKHRLTLLELLKQTFQYGRGGGLLSKTIGMKSAFSKWIFLCVLSFAFWISIVLSLTLLAIFAGSTLALAMLLILLVLPPIGLIIFYTRRSFNEKHRKPRKILVYPFIDIMRAIAFAAGVVYQLLK
jgi:glycosyltransferase involved in cell wall biosynthesis